ncbi:unnamed protein product, partial [marine sediment metagenome]
GAFVEDEEKVEKLAKIMVNIGKGFGKKTRAIITDMSQPLGNAIGNSLEVEEAIKILKGNGSQDFNENIEEIILRLVGRNKSINKSTITPPISRISDAHIKEERSNSGLIITMLTATINIERIP